MSARRREFGGARTGLASRVTGLALLAVLGALSVRPQAQAGSAADRARAEDEVRAADTGMFDAVNACAPEAWDRVVADDMVLIIIGGTTFDKAKLRGDFFGVTMHPVPCDTVYTNEPMKVRVYDTVAIVTGNLSYKGRGNGRMRDLQRIIYTRVYEKRGTAWRFVLGQHTSTKTRQDGPF